ncbi:MAG: hypothetical protein Q8Q49_01880, partial [bacterium]|nr:hypothetical protein [bacterium]
MSNLEIAKLLRNVATAYVIKDENKFKFQLLAYQKASETIAGLNGELFDYYRNNKLDLLPGIGPTIKSHLVELFKTGKVKHFDWVLNKIPKSVYILTEIPTFGPKKAFRLVNEFELNNPNTVLKDLSSLAREGKIAKLEGFGQKSQDDIIRAINEFKMGVGKTTRMTLPYAFETAEKLLEYLRNEKYIEKVEALGSLRRKASTVGDIDIAIATKEPKKTIEYFISYPFKERVIEKGDISASILVTGGRQIDLLIQPFNAFGSLLQHFTGSKNHNV